jgi:hypothetical protein
MRVRVCLLQLFCAGLLAGCPESGAEKSGIVPGDAGGSDESIRADGPADDHDLGDSERGEAGDGRENRVPDDVVDVETGATPWDGKRDWDLDVTDWSFEIPQLPEEVPFVDPGWPPDLLPQETGGGDTEQQGWDLLELAEAEIPPDPDPDGDGLEGPADNCPLAFNPEQTDTDTDGLGDECDWDDDDDGVQDDKDEAPLDPGWPGLATEGWIYAHTSGTLYRWSSTAMALELIGNFGWPGGYDTMTDIAVDYDGRLYGVSFSVVYRCSAVTAACISLAGLPTSFNGLTVVPQGTLEPDEEVLVGIGNDGSWNRIDVVGNLAVVTKLGSYGAGYTSSGDAYSIEGFGTYASVNKSGVWGGNLLVRVDPLNGTVLEEVGLMQGYSTVYGLASDGENAYAFDESGAILKLDIATGQVEVALPAAEGEPWWGAGVTTRYFAGQE